MLLARAEGPLGFERPVVLKVLLPQFQRDEPFLRRFVREASAYARLTHPSIVKLYDFFSAEGRLVMVLEYIDGPTLTSLIRKMTNLGLVIDDQAALYVMSSVFAALASAHAARDPNTGELAPVIHRDVNPSNVLIPRDGYVKLTDFGIAKIAGTASDTQVGLLQGTYGYMAPEQARGESVSTRADVYSATILLWELLARRKAIRAGELPEIQILQAMAEPSIVSLDVLRPDLDPSLREAVRRGLEPHADKRRITAEEMYFLLREFAGEGHSRLVDAIERVRNTPSEIPPPESPAEPIRDLYDFSEDPPTQLLNRSGEREARMAPKRPNTPFFPISNSTPPAAPTHPRQTLLGVAGPSRSVPPPVPHNRPPKPRPAAGVPAAPPAGVVAAPASSSPGESPPLPSIPRPSSRGTTPSPSPARAHEVSPATLPFEPVRSSNEQEPRATMPEVDPLRAERSFSQMNLEATATETPGTNAPPPADSAAPLAPVFSPVPDASSAPVSPQPARGKGPRVLLVGMFLLIVVASGLGTLLAARWYRLRQLRAAGAPAAMTVPRPTTAAQAPSSAEPPPVASSSADASAQASAAIPTPTPAAEPTAKPEAKPSLPEPAGETRVEASAGLGDISTANAQRGRRIFVDDHVVGQTPETVRVKCGAHAVRIGSSGKAQAVDVPCGGEIKVP